MVSNFPKETPLGALPPDQLLRTLRSLHTAKQGLLQLLVEVTAEKETLLQQRRQLREEEKQLQQQLE
ncbi:hypothetical protein ETH_00013720 [Eimeria tenella]|uniref:Uncharacterized protein n=1 Tax=Eimeria tenella TaxID=5802 RepID=U6L846_EIMTE|nr:hypothetical protein ETH_00013720 [Eimeria tenella]CDJ45383.1 hypothetical protein ETH_00013720 [Eimeria tenella]|eukprot:XP_013236129.1 hypothetical protein ETH_00013720 [Eimeria tenella]